MGQPGGAKHPIAHSWLAARRGRSSVALHHRDLVGSPVAIRRWYRHRCYYSSRPPVSSTVVPRSGTISWFFGVAATLASAVATNQEVARSSRAGRNYLSGGLPPPDPPTRSLARCFATLAPVRVARSLRSLALNSKASPRPPTRVRRRDLAVTIPECHRFTTRHRQIVE